ncbi:MAG: Gfo/Idh/MocA family protein [Christensenellales bacterium]|jgi:predicted dehydrogenase
MKICFAGLGSIGKRHLRNLVSVLGECGQPREIHALRRGKKALNAETGALIDKQAFSMEELDGDYDAVFITNPTLLHYEALRALLPRTKHAFIEKPLFERANYDVAALPFREGGVYYVAAPLRFSGVFRCVAGFVEKERVFCARAISSSYLPDWRQGVDYRDTYSARRELGGGVTLDLIHEWDYLKALFGPPKTLHRISGRFSELEITSDDISCYLAGYDDKIVEVHLDYFGREIRRLLELYTREGVLYADFLNRSVTLKNGRNARPLPVSEADQYLEEMRHFIGMCLGLRHENPNTVSNALETLKLATGGLL